MNGGFQCGLRCHFLIQVAPCLQKAKKSHLTPEILIIIQARSVKTNGDFQTGAHRI